MSLEPLEDRTLLDSGLGIVNNPSALASPPFAHQLYHVLLNREPSAPEVSGWATALASNLARTESVMELLHSPDFIGRMLTQNYSQLLGRDPDPGASNLWLQAIQGAGTYQSMTESILASPEYFNRHGGDNYQWVTALYADVLGRQPDWPGLLGWVSFLNAGAPRATVAVQFVQSEEAHIDAVADAYLTLLGRQPEEPAFTLWVTALNRGMTEEQLAAGVAGSDEFKALVDAGQTPLSQASPWPHGLVRPFASFLSVSTLPATSQNPGSGPNSATPAGSAGPFIIGTDPKFGDKIPLFGDCGCGGGSGGGGADGELVNSPPGAQGGNPMSYSFCAYPVRYSDGVARVVVPLLGSAGYGMPWGHTLTWTNNSTANTNINGSGIIVSQLPRIIQSGADVVYDIVVTNGVNARVFNDATLSEDHFLRDSLSYDATNNQYIFTDPSGDQIKFYDFTAWPTNQQGQFRSFTDPEGNVTSVTSHSTDGKVAEVQRTTTSGGNTIIESYLYSYIASGTNLGLMQSVTVRRQINGGAWSTVRAAQFTYYDGTQSYGNAGNLMTATVQDGSGNTLDTNYFRYYTSTDSTHGYVGGLKYYFSPTSYARLIAANPNPQTATNAQVAPFADNYFEYDSTKSVTKETAQGAGCSSCSGGLGTFTFASVQSRNTKAYNSWATKTTVGLPDGNTDIEYTNTYGEVMLQVHQDATTGQNWETFFQYDTGTGRLIMKAMPSAVTGYDDTKADLLNKVKGNYQYLSDTTGLIYLFDYYISGTATGYYQDTKVEQGELGTAVLQETDAYTSHTVNAVTISPVASNTVYRNTDGTGAETTTYAYTFFTGTNQVQSLTITRPVISAAQNGPGTADTFTTFFDTYSRAIWTKDADGFINYTAYDPATSAVTKTITDVDTTRTADFQNLPSGWVTPAGGGLHLITQIAVDSFGRPTVTTDPNGNVTYQTYNDPNYETRIYPGWNSATQMPTGPTQDYRQDRPGSYLERLTMTATPHLTGGVPDGTEAISNLQTLSRDYTNSAGQFTTFDVYFNLSGVTYSTAANIGTQDANYYRTLVSYDVLGRRNRVQRDTVTIERTVYDGESRIVSTWVGTNDTPASGSWSPTNNTSPSNMIQITANVYDGGGVGDSNLTQTTVMPGGSAANRVQQLFYDWRDRLVATKDGVQVTEDTTTHRPIYYYDLDNLGETVGTSRYDGDGVTITSTNGVPNKPSASVLRAYGTTAFDDQQRAYATHVFSVDQTNGTISSSSLNTLTWYNHRGLVIESLQPGGLVTKSGYDGAARVTRTYQTDGASGTTWSAAGSVTGDNVLEQVENQYDSNGNLIFVTTRQRFHNETTTGALGNPTTAPLARVYYATAYFDAANRRTADVNVGTNGGTAYTRPSTVPSVSDTVLVTLYAYSSAGWMDTITDPRGIVQKSFYDALGRRTKAVEAYTDGIPTNITNGTTEYTYDGSSHMVTLQADLPAGAYQQTKFVYGVTTASGSDVNSNDLLSATQYPDKTTGNPSASQQETYAVNAPGQRKTLTDRNGNVHTYTFDVLGRTTADAVTTLGTGVDGAVRRLEFAFDTGGRPYLYTSFDSATGGNIVNQMQQLYNGLNQLITEYQSSSGAVNTSTTPKVQYAYSQMAGGANHSRPITITYPNGRVLNYNYNTGLDDSISRLSSISDSGVTLESYSYLALGTAVRRSHPQPGVDFTYVKQTGESNGDAGDQYTGLDRFGRVVDQRWIVTATGTATDRFQYGYDRDGNRLYRNNLVNSSFGELYHANGASNGYDQLNQLTAFSRGVLSASGSTLDTIVSPSHSQSWSFDALGNWSNFVSDSTTQTRTHNSQNQITSISGSTTPTYDNNGNTTTDQNGKSLVFDAWNRLVAYKSGGTVLVSYALDALNRRIIENPGTQRVLYYSASWQVLEEDVSGSFQDQYVWSPVYVDAMIERDRPTERLYVQQDANWNVTAVIDTTGTVQERYIYDPYGAPSFLDSSWNTRVSSLFAWNYLHQGGRYDTTTGLYSFRNRDLSAALGRWTEMDPLEFGAGDNNFYRYVDNEPSTHVDPSGLQPVPGDPFPGMPAYPPKDPKEDYFVVGTEPSNGREGQFTEMKVTTKAVKHYLIFKYATESGFQDARNKPLRPRDALSREVWVVSPIYPGRTLYFTRFNGAYRGGSKRYRGGAGDEAVLLQAGMGLLFASPGESRNQKFDEGSGFLRTVAPNAVKNYRLNPGERLVIVPGPPPKGGGGC
jgi:RHS repeat-associated protein